MRIIACVVGIVFHPIAHLCISSMCVSPVNNFFLNEYAYITSTKVSSRPKSEYAQILLMKHLKSSLGYL